MAQRITVNDLMEEVRAQLDEANTVSVSDSADILPALNRGQNYAVDILARNYKEALLTSTIITLVPNQSTYPIPEDAFEQRLLKIESLIGGVATELSYLSYQDIDSSTTFSSGLPGSYTILGLDFLVYPTPVAAGQIKIWYLKDPLPLVSSQGRITVINTTDNYINVDSVGEDLETVSDNLQNYVNIIDGTTGLRKGTMQILNLVPGSTKITFKTVADRATVLDATVSTDLADISVAIDDYICLVKGSCVPFFKKPISNFIVQYAVAELTRKLGGENGAEQQVLEKFERQMERTWAQRPNNLRVQNRLPSWSRTARSRRSF